MTIALTKDLTYYSLGFCENKVSPILPNDQARACCMNAISIKRSKVIYVKMESTVGKTFEILLMNANNTK